MNNRTLFKLKCSLAEAICSLLQPDTEANKKALAIARELEAEASHDTFETIINNANETFNAPNKQKLIYLTSALYLLNNSEVQFSKDRTPLLAQLSEKVASLITAIDDPNSKTTDDAEAYLSTIQAFLDNDMIAEEKPIGDLTEEDLAGKLDKYDEEEPDFTSIIPFSIVCQKTQQDTKTKPPHTPRPRQRSRSI